MGWAWEGGVIPPNSKRTPKKPTQISTNKEMKVGIQKMNNFSFFFFFQLPSFNNIQTLVNYLPALNLHFWFNL